jgi:Fur family ferric uptake transcriptional regulator
MSHTTVYRNLKNFMADGSIAVVQVPGQAPRYELASAAAKHHHHFHCERCDRLFDLPGCARLATPGAESIPGRAA